jgi:hypothetical protein
MDDRRLTVHSSNPTAFRKIQDMPVSHLKEPICVRLVCFLLEPQLGLRIIAKVRHIMGYHDCFKVVEAVFDATDHFERVGWNFGSQTDKIVVLRQILVL